MLRWIIVLSLVVGVAGVSLESAEAAIIVRVEPLESTQAVGAPFSVELRADIDEPVLGFGLDVNFDLGLAELVDAAIIGPVWFPVSSADGDEIAGLAFPDPIVGLDVLLATVSLRGFVPGLLSVSASFSLDDPTEGFALDPEGFAEVEFSAAAVSIVPEPRAVLLIAAAVACLRTMRRGSPASRWRARSAAARR